MATIWILDSFHWWYLPVFVCLCKFEFEGLFHLVKGRRRFQQFVSCFHSYSFDSIPNIRWRILQLEQELKTYSKQWKWFRCQIWEHNLGSKFQAKKSLGSFVPVHVPVSQGLARLCLGISKQNVCVQYFYCDDSFTDVDIRKWVGVADG